MLLYLTIFLIPAFIYLLTAEKPSKYRNYTFLLTYVGGLAIFVGIADMLGGYDRYIYGELFDYVADQLKAGVPFYKTLIFEQYPSELGFDMLNVLIGFITRNRYIFILIVTLLIYSSLFVALKKYVENYPFAIVLFLALMFFFTFTYLRQILAVSIIWHSIPYIEQRKKWKFLLIAVISATFHNSTLLFVPFYFMPIKKFSKDSVVWIMLACFLIGLWGPINSLYDAYADVSGDTSRMAGYEVGSGFRIAYFIEAVFFLFYILNNYEKVGHNKLQIILLNMAIIFCGVLLVFIKSENGGRLSWCFFIGLIATLTSLATRIKYANSISMVLIVVSFFLYMRIFIAWQAYLNLYPYKTFFTDGYRDGDYTWELYEYDHNYDEDKFYR